MPSLSILSSTPGKCISITMGRTEVLMYLHLPGPFLLWLIPGHLPASLAPVFFPRLPCFLEWWLWDGSSGRSRKTLISSFQLDQGSRFLLRLHCNHKSLLYGTQKGKGNFTVTRCSPTTDNFSPKTVGGYASRLNLYHCTAFQGKLLSMLGESIQWYT